MRGCMDSTVQLLQTFNPCISARMHVCAWDCETKGWQIEQIYHGSRVLSSTYFVQSFSRYSNSSHIRIADRYHASCQRRHYLRAGMLRETTCVLPGNMAGRPIGLYSPTNNVQNSCFVEHRVVTLLTSLSRHGRLTKRDDRGMISVSCQGLLISPVNIFVSISRSHLRGEVHFPQRRVENGCGLLRDGLDEGECPLDLSLVRLSVCHSCTSEVHELE